MLTSKCSVWLGVTYLLKGDQVFVNHKDYMYDMIHADDFFEQIDDFINNTCWLVRSAYRNVHKKRKYFTIYFDFH